MWSQRSSHYPEFVLRKVLQTRKFRRLKPEEDSTQDYPEASSRLSRAPLHIKVHEWAHRELFKAVLPSQGTHRRHIKNWEVKIDAAEIPWLLIPSMGHAMTFLIFSHNATNCFLLAPFLSDTANIHIHSLFSPNSNPDNYYSQTLENLAPETQDMTQLLTGWLPFLGSTEPYVDNQ